MGAMKRMVLLYVSIHFGWAPLRGQAISPPLDQELREVQMVFGSDRFQAALSYIEQSDSETVQEWLGVCNADGPSGSEEARSRLLYRLFRIYGLENVHIDDALNVIGVRPGTGDGPTVILNAHHDNVHLSPVGQPVEAFVADGRVWCPAAFDDVSGIVQMLTTLRAMNEANIETVGDVWFVSFTGEEAPIGPSHPEASPGVEQFVRANYPHNIDWHRGDIMLQFHGRGGDGVTTGSIPVRHRTQLRVFASFERDRWGPHAVDALARIISRIGPEVRDPRSTDLPFEHVGDPPVSSDVLYINMAMIGASEVTNRPASEAWVRFDMRADTEERLWDAHRQIQAIAAAEVQAMGDEFSFVYEINSKNGTAEGIAGWNQVSNRPARIAAAAARALYGVQGVIDPTTGCGDCVRAYRSGMPAMSLRGSVIDHGRGQFEVRGDFSLQSAVRRRTATHDVTESGLIAGLWAGVKHGLLFAVAYAGLSN
jgi:acetylornithine deacetylase/succinyl-diaminopimelate desuccinylase-like protein